MRVAMTVRGSAPLLALGWLATGCVGDGTGLLALKISADAANPPSPGTSIELTGTGGIHRTLSAKFPPDGGGSIVIEYPDLPASSGGLDIDLRLLDASGCVVGETASAVRVFIHGGGKTTAEVFLGKSANVCRDGGASGGGSEGGVSDGPADLPRGIDLGAELPVDLPVDAGAVADVAEDANRRTGLDGAEDKAAEAGQDLPAIGPGDGPANADAYDVTSPDLADVPVGATGGSPGTGGATGTGGRVGTGGALGSGGATGTGGAGSGGAGGTSAQPVCGDGVAQNPETCDPPSACQTLANACVSDANTVRTPSGSVSSCTFVCTSAPRACVAGDGFCPTGCLHATDGDCPKEPGEACTTGNECRLGFCANSVCCDRACTGACEACNRAGSLGKCTLPDYNTDPANCGGCGNACSSMHMATVSCAGGTCNGTCAVGFKDCNSGLLLDGCETEVDNNPTSCGTCGTICPYGVCQANACPSTKDGLFTPGASSANRFTGTEYCHRVHIANAGHLAALGIDIGAATAGVKFRLALYTSSSNAPLNLVAQTNELSSVPSSPVEGLVTSVSVAAADYWLCLATSATLRVTTEATLTGPTYTGTMSYGNFIAVAPVMTLASPDPLITNVYTVSTP